MGQARHLQLQEILETCEPVPLQIWPHVFSSTDLALTKRSSPNKQQQQNVIFLL